MINLVPKEEKQKMVKSFYYRFTTICLLAFSLSILIGVMAMAPSYFLVYLKKDLADKKLEIQKNEPMPVLDQQTALVIEDLNHKLDLIQNAEKSKFLVSEKVVDAILAKKITDIKIIEIDYKNDISGGRSINIQGFAPSRETLLSFRLGLEKDENFKQVDLPISNFVKGSDIKFSLSLIPS